VTTAADTPLNLTLVAVDPENAPLNYAIATPPAHGSLSGTPPSVTYTPTTGFSGLDSSPSKPAMVL